MEGGAGDEHRQRQDGHQARCGADHPELEPSTVGPVRVDSQHRDHAGLEGEAQDLRRDVARRQPPALSQSVTGRHQPDQATDERSREGTEDEEPACQPRHRADAGTPTRRRRTRSRTACTQTRTTGSDVASHANSTIVPAVATAPRHSAPQVSPREGNVSATRASSRSLAVRTRGRLAGFGWGRRREHVGGALRQLGGLPRSGRRRPRPSVPEPTPTRSDRQPEGTS